MLHKLRSALTVLGVVFGVGSVIAMLAVGEGASREALDQISKLGSHNIIIDTIKPEAGESRDSRRVRMNIYGLLYEDEVSIRESIPSIKRTVPVKIMRKQARLGTREMDVRMVGTTPDWFDLVSRDVLAGRLLNAGDESGRANVVVLTEYGARRLLATKESIGENLRIGGVSFEVVGIVRSETISAGGMQTPDRETDAYIPMTVARERFGDFISESYSGTHTREWVELHQVIAEIDALEHVEPAAEAIRVCLARRHRVPSYRIQVPLALLRQARATKRTFNIVLGSIAGISLLVGGIGIMNIMLASVTERTREIGIRRAVGARRRQIVGQFLIETVVLSTSGGIIGVAIGVLIPKVISRFAGMTTIVTLQSLVLSLGISMGVGILFGIYPAFRAAKLDPIVALRHE